MGHARLTNISRTASRLIRRQEGATLREITAELILTKQAVHAGEGLLYEQEALAMAASDYLWWLRGQGCVTPVNPTEQQAIVLKQWGTAASDKWTSSDDGKGGECGVLDSIRWVTPRKMLPLLHRIEHSD